MIRLVYSEGFSKSLSKLPHEIQRKTAALLEIVEANPFHPLLPTKKLTGQLAGFLSFRITRDFRVFFRFLNPNTIQLLRAMHRKDVYR